jgi:hypothetical protein
MAYSVSGVNKGKPVASVKVSHAALLTAAVIAVSLIGNCPSKRTGWHSSFLFSWVYLVGDDLDQATTRSNTAAARGRYSGHTNRSGRTKRSEPRALSSRREGKVPALGQCALPIDLLEVDSGQLCV